MSDRVRIGELLAAIGAIALSALLLFGVWFRYGTVLPGGVYTIGGSVGARHLGWFALLITALAAIAGLLFLYRVLTSETTDRPMLQAPVAYAAALLALIIDAIRMLCFSPTIDIDGTAVRELGNQTIHLDTTIAAGGWTGLGSLLLMMVGTWIAMADERKDTPAARQRTEALLARVPVRPAPPAGGAPESDADAVAEDQLPDASEPTSPSTGDSA